jgi:hypothetical protein
MSRPESAQPSLQAPPGRRTHLGPRPRSPEYLGERAPGWSKCRRAPRGSSRGAEEREPRRGSLLRRLVARGERALHVHPRDIEHRAAIPSEARGLHRERETGWSKCLLTPRAGRPDARRKGREHWKKTFPHGRLVVWGAPCSCVLAASNTGLASRRKGPEHWRRIFSPGRLVGRGTHLAVLPRDIEPRAAIRKEGARPWKKDLLARAPRFLGDAPCSCFLATSNPGLPSQARSGTPRESPSRRAPQRPSHSRGLTRLRAFPPREARTRWRAA